MVVVVVFVVVLLCCCYCCRNTNVIIFDLNLQISNRLLDKHRIYVQPINYPTVPKGTERFRLTCSPVHTVKEIDHLVSSLTECWLHFGLAAAAKSTVGSFIHHHHHDSIINDVKDNVRLVTTY